MARLTHCARSARRSGCPFGTLLVAACITTLCGCAGYTSGFTQPERVGTSLAAYNIAVAKAQNEVIFLNIVRSMLREPRHFTAVTQLRRAAQNGSLELSIPFGGGSDDKYSITPNFSGSMGPSADVAVLDSDEFVKGILDPIRPEFIDYFVKQGWPESFLWTLLIREVAFKVDSLPNDPSDDEVKFTNRPGEDGGGSDGLPQFARVVNALTKCHLRVEQREGEPVGPQLTAQDLKDIEKIAALKQANLVLAAENKEHPDLGLWQIRKPEAYYFTLGAPLAAEKVVAPPAPATATPAVTPKAGAIKLPITSLKSLPECESALHDLKNARLDAKVDSPEETLSGEIRLRSTEGVIYYLGELMRDQVTEYQMSGKTADSKWDAGDGRGFIHFALSEHRQAVLFRAKPGSWSESKRFALVKVRYRRTVYVIPAPELPERKLRDGSIDYTSGTLNFVNLLLGLHKSSKDLPRTGAVEVVGSGR